MLAWFIHLLQLLTALASPHRALALENLALRQQLGMLRRTRSKPPVRWFDRVFWIALRRTWPEWRSALVIILTRHGHRVASPWFRLVLGPDGRVQSAGGRK